MQEIRMSTGISCWEKKWLKPWKQAEEEPVSYRKINSFSDEPEEGTEAQAVHCTTNNLKPCTEAPGPTSPRRLSVCYPCTCLLS